MYGIVLITVTHNSSNFLPKLIVSALSALKKYKIDKWIFIDTNSRDNTLKVLDDLKKRYGELNIVVIGEKKNLGFSKAVEKAVSTIRKYLGDDTLLIIINPDGFFGPNSLDGLIKFSRKNAGRGIGLIQPLILQPDRTIDSAGNLFSITGVVCPNTSLKSPFFYISGACFLTRYGVYKSVGGIDTDIFMGADDLDLSWRVRLSGLDLKVYSRSIFYHYRRSGEGISPKRLEWRVFSILWSMIKNMPYRKLVVSIPSFIFIHMGIAIALSIYFNLPDYIIHYIKAVLSVFKKLNILMRKRIYTRYYIKKMNDNIVLNNLTPSGYVLKTGYIWYLKWRK